MAKIIIWFDRGGPSLRRADFTGAKMIVDELGDDGKNGVNLQTLISLLPGGLEGGMASWSGARFGDVSRSYPTPSQWLE